ncbi:cytochrome P-450 cyp509A1 [Halteromyces radiatus]|uniref:cytochrome P-450 cyp509A1 n=1 Tax=Halteromyces radiatus TaxID=101107 RepID=UPI00221F51DF|nr:cytochrome P-450 cyp509A1 [Halteromyces radiatus]KAI8093091.1 cytochrome P-450 cyp509A1 [Halteromyces radiatus]
MSQLLQSLDLGKNLQTLLVWYNKYLSKYTDTRVKRITIGFSIAILLLCRKVYHITVPPKNLRHIPHIKFIDTVKSFAINKLSTSDNFKQINSSIVRDSNGIYVSWDREGWMVTVANPEAVKQVFMKSDIFPKLDVDNFPGSLGSRFISSSNILQVNGQEWKKHRKLANPAFHRSMPVKFFGEKSQELFNYLNKENPGDSFIVDVGNIMERVTLDVIGMAGFGFNFSSLLDKNSEWKQIYDDVNRNVMDPMYALFPFLEQKFLWLFPKRQQAHKTLDKFLGMLNGIVEHKRQVLKNNIDNNVEEAEKDLLTLMIESELRGEGVLTNEELMADLGVFFVAGHDTTSFALSAVIYYLAKYPDIQEKARQEINNVLCPDGEPKEDILVTAEQTKQFIYLNQVIKETLRIAGSVVMLAVPRRTTEDVMLSGTLIPKNTLVSVNIYDLHHNPDVWTNPETFDPDRFSPGAEADQKVGTGLAWVPFANGSRVCIGQNFSLMEQRVILSGLLRRYHWNLPNGSLHKEELITGNSFIMSAKKLDIEFHKRF